MRTKIRRWAVRLAVVAVAVVVLCLLASLPAY